MENSESDTTNSSEFIEVEQQRLDATSVIADNFKPITASEVEVNPIPLDIDGDLYNEYLELRESIAKKREMAMKLRSIVSNMREGIRRDEEFLRNFGMTIGINAENTNRGEDVLRGRRLAEVAVNILKENRRSGEIIHYREWFSLLKDSGYQVGGKDPLATFLASVSKSQAIRSVGNRSGLYTYNDYQDVEN